MPHLIPKNTYDVYIIYDTSNTTYPIIANNNGTERKISKSYIPASTKVNNARITIGGNGIDSNNDSTMKLIFFEITECNGSFNSSYQCV